MTLEFSEELVGGSTDAFAVTTNGGNTVNGYSNGDVDVGTAVHETQVSYVICDVEGC